MRGFFCTIHRYLHRYLRPFAIESCRNTIVATYFGSRRRAAGPDSGISRLMTEPPNRLQGIRVAVGRSEAAAGSVCGGRAPTGALRQALCDRYSALELHAKR